MNKWKYFFFLTSDCAAPQAIQIFSTFVELFNTCSTRLHRSVMTYWSNPSQCSTSIPSSRNSASTNCPHVVSFVIPDIQRCSPRTQIGISSVSSNESSFVDLSSSMPSSGDSWKWLCGWCLKIEETGALKTFFGRQFI